MSDQSLLKQLLNRVATFQSQHPAITQAQIAKVCNIAEGNFSRALAGKRGLSADSCLKLHKLLNLSNREVARKFGMPVLTSQIMNLQERGKPLQFDNSGWVAGLGEDPNESTSITETASADTKMDIEATIATLRTAKSLHEKAIAAIDDFIVNADVRAKVNRNGPTAPSSQKFSTGTALESLNKKVMTRVIKPEDRDYFLERDLTALRERHSSLDNREIALANEKAKEAIKLETKQLEARKIQLKHRYSK